MKAPSCEELELAPHQLAHCRVILMGARKVTCDELGFFPAPEVVLDRSEGPTARLERINLAELEAKHRQRFEWQVQVELANREKWNQFLGKPWLPGGAETTKQGNVGGTV